jgi:hypothetical protein
MKARKSEGKGDVSHSHNISLAPCFSKVAPGNLRLGNRFNGFRSKAVETAWEVKSDVRTTSLKRAANEMSG